MFKTVSTIKSIQYFLNVVCTLVDTLIDKKCFQILEHFDHANYEKISNLFINITKKSFLIATTMIFLSNIDLDSNFEALFISIARVGNLLSKFCESNNVQGSCKGQNGLNYSDFRIYTSVTLPLSYSVTQILKSIKGMYIVNT